MILIYQSAFRILWFVTYETVKTGMEEKKTWFRDNFLCFQVFETFENLGIDFSFKLKKSFWAVINVFKVTHFFLLKVWKTTNQVRSISLQCCCNAVTPGIFYLGLHEALLSTSKEVWNYVDLNSPFIPGKNMKLFGIIFLTYQSDSSDLQDLFEWIFRQNILKLVWSCSLFMTL